MTLLEVAKQALEAMEDAMYRADTHEFYDAKESLRYAIEQAEQAEQEPVALNDGRLTQYPDGRIGVGTPAEPEQEPVAHSVVAGALFDFMGWLTSRRERLVLSSVDNAAPAADAIKDFAEMRGLNIDDAQVKEWQDNITASTPRKPLTDEEIVDIWAGVSMDYDDEINIIELARAIERHHGIGEQQ